MLERDRIYLPAEDHAAIWRDGGADARGAGDGGVSRVDSL